MLRTLAAFALLPLAAATAAAPPPALVDELVALEKQSWTAWQARDAAFFDSFLSADHVEVGIAGPAGKELVLKVVGSSACTVAGWSVDRFSATQAGPDAVLLVYHAAQDTTCGGKPVPSPVWASSLYVRRDGRWQNLMYQQTPTRDDAKASP